MTPEHTLTSRNLCHKTETGSGNGNGFLQSSAILRNYFEYNDSLSDTHKTLNEYFVPSRKWLGPPVIADFILLV